VQAAFKRSAASLFATGVTIEEATTLISVLQERTQRGGDVVGTALKTLASRISVSTSEATKALNSIGVATLDQQGNLRNLFDILRDTSAAFQSLTEAEQSNVAVKAAGIRQVEIFRAAVLDFNRMQDVNNQLINASGDAARKQAAEQSKLANVLSRLQIGMQQLIKTASEGIVGKAFVFVLTTTEKIVTAVAEFDKRIGGAISTFGGIVAIVLGMKVLIPMLTGIGRAIKFFIGFQKEAAVAMGGIQKGAQAVGQTIQGQMNMAMQRTATMTAETNAGMATLGATTAATATQAERLAMAMQASVAGRAGAGTMGAGGVARGGRDPLGGAVIVGGAAQKLSKEAQAAIKPVSKFGRTVGAVGKGFKFMGRHALGFGLIASIVGGQLKAAAEGLRGEGRGGLATAAEIGGGALTGAATGALLGSFLPGLGTAIGAALGGIVGAAGPAIAAFRGVENGIDDLGRKYIELGIIQAENGRITTEVATQLDKALRNLEAFRDFELGLEESRLKNLFDPAGAAGRQEKVEKRRENAIKGLQASFDRSASEQIQGNQILLALSKALQARTGQQALDLAAPELRKRGAPVLGQFGEPTLRAIQAEVELFAERFGVSVDKANAIFEEEIAKIKAKPLTAEAIDEARAAIEKDVSGFIASLDLLIPAGEQIGAAAREQAEKFKVAVAQVALGEGGKEAQQVIKDTLSKVLTGQTLIRGEGGTFIRGVGGKEELRSRAEQAKALAARRAQVGVVGVGGALPQIIKRLLPLLRRGVGERQGERREVRIAKSRAEMVEAFESLRKEFPLRNIGKFLDRPVNKLELILRSFIADFGREVLKLTEAQIRATTPQVALADALAKNAQEMVQATKRRGALEISDAILRATEEIQKLPGRGRPVEDGGTVGDVMNELFQNLLDANRRIIDEGIVDPDKQREVITQARKSVDTTSLNEKQIQAVADQVSNVTKMMVKLDVEGLQAIVKSNSLALSALKKRISEEERALSLSKRRRAAAALNARATVEELTGIRRLVAEREIEANLTDSNIAAQKGFIASLDGQITALRAVQQTEENRVGILNQIETLERRRADESIKLEEQLANRRIQAIRDTLQVANQAIQAARMVGNEERKRISTLASVNSLLSVDRTEMQKFNAELETLGAQFRASQATLAAETVAVNATITDEAEKKERLASIQKRGAALALEQAKAEAQIIAKRREAIKQVAQELLGNQQEQVDAQKAIIDATQGVSEAFEGYLQAVDGAIMATTRYNLGLQLAEVQATRVTGGFTGIREELSAVQDAFRSAESLVRDLGGSERTLVEIRRESINQQLSLFNNLLSQQSQLARGFFTSSAQSQADLFLGIKEAQNIASLLGGSFEDFKTKGEGAINDLGAQLLALPQETRQRVLSSLETLASVGGAVGGFTADELLTAIETAALGVSGEGLKIDPLFEVQDRIAKLTEEQAKLATEQLVSSQEQVMNAKEQLEVAQAAKDLAEIQLERIKEEGEKLRGKLGDLRGQLNTTLLQQDQTARQGFNAVTSAVARAANAVITSLPDAFSVKVAEAFREVMREGGLAGAAPTGDRGFVSDSRQTPQGRGREQVNARRAQGRNLAEAAQIASQGANGTLVPASAAAGAPTGRASNNPNDPGAAQTNRSLQSILDELKGIKTNSDANLAVTEEIRDSSGDTIGTAAATVTGPAEINISIEGTSTVTVTGFEAGVARVAAALTETFGGFATEEEARRIANEVLENIRTELLRRGIITPTTL
jgi:hypothetical protein